MKEKNNFLSLRTVFIILASLIAINIIFLDIFIFRDQKAEIAEKTIPIPVTLSSCPASCISEINNATGGAALSNKPASVLIPISIPTFTPVPTLKQASPTVAPTQTQSLVKEFFVPFGTGSNYSDDWQDLPGIKATINPANYGDIKTITFEATIRIPTGNETAYVRLYDATGNHPVWFSDMSLDGGTPQLLISKPISLDTGNRTYQVQMKTSLKYPAYLDQARLHIIAD